MGIKLVSCCILRKQDKYLISKRLSSKILANFWEFPGGKLEINESFQSAIVRELHEELGIRTAENHLVNLDFLTHQYRKNEIIILGVFYLKKWLGVARSKEGQQIDWLTISEIKKLNFLEGSKVILDKLSSEAYNFYF